MQVPLWRTAPAIDTAVLWGVGGTQGSLTLWLESIRSKCRALADLQERLVALGMGLC